MSDFFGSLVSGIFDWSAGKKQREAQAHANTSNAELQRDFAQSGITWRVQDAKRAGLHPLYAIGASVTPGQASYQADSGAEFTSRMGQNLGRAASAAMDSDARAEQRARLKVLESEADKNFAMASAARSEEQRLWLSQWTAKPLNLDGGGLRADPLWGLSSDVGVHRARSPEGMGVGSSPPRPGQIKGKPDEVISARPGAPQVTAGTHSAFREYQVTPTLKMQLPYSEEGPGEALENVPLYLWPSILSYNSQYYGRQFTDQFGEFLMGPGAYKLWKDGPPWQKPTPGPYKRGYGRSQ